MPNDAKLGLIVGVAVVLLIAVIFFRKEEGTSPTANTAAVSTMLPQLPPLPESPATSDDLPPLPPVVLPEP